MSSNIKRGKGRPPKVKAHDSASIISKIKEEEQRFAAKCAENLGKLFKTIFDLAGDDDAPIKDQVAATKYCIEFAQKFEEENEGVKSKSEDNNKEEKKAPLISLSSKS
jgi:sugar-specific transcriptional regulator TrmB